MEFRGAAIQQPTIHSYPVLYFRAPSTPFCSEFLNLCTTRRIALQLNRKAKNQSPQLMLAVAITTVGMACTSKRRRQQLSRCLDRGSCIGFDPQVSLKDC